jgi:hypothetical protein
MSASMPLCTRARWFRAGNLLPPKPPRQGRKTKLPSSNWEREYRRALGGLGLQHNEASGAHGPTHLHGGSEPHLWPKQQDEPSFLQYLESSSEHEYVSQGGRAHPALSHSYGLNNGVAYEPAAASYLPHMPPSPMMPIATTHWFSAPQPDGQMGGLAPPPLYGGPVPHHARGILERWPPLGDVLPRPAAHR